MLTYQRAQVIREQFMNQIIRTGNIPAELVHPFFDYYNTEFRPGAYGSLPCTCNPRTWSEMVEQVTSEINRVEKEEELRKLAAEKAAAVVSPS